MTTWGPTELVLENLLDSEEIHAENDGEEYRYPNYGLSWSKYIYKDLKSGEKLHLFACCGGKKAEIVALQKDNPEAPLRPWSTFIDDDPDEKFRATEFGGKSTSGSPFLILGGKATIIKLVDIDRRCLAHALKGHTYMVNDLKVSPKHESLLLSAAADESIRMWNLNVPACIAVFAGRHGHRKAVLSISWHFEGESFASSGADGYVRLWNGLSDVNVLEALHATRPMPGESVVRGRPYYDLYPRFASNKLHASPVDCVHWLRDGRMLSRCMDNEFLVWEPDFSSVERQKRDLTLVTYPPAKEVVVFMRFQAAGRPNYFSRFSVDALDEQLAVGEAGTTSIWNLDGEEMDDVSLDDTELAFADDDWLDHRLDPSQTLSIQNRERVRVAAFCPHGKILVACSDEGNLYQWRPSANQH